MAKNKVELVDESVVMENAMSVLKLTYIVTTVKDKREVVFNIPLNIWKDKLPDIYRETDVLPCVRGFYGPPTTYVNAGFGKIEMDHYLRKTNTCIYKEEVLETFTHEMTISEIEEKLGYKIKIVNEKEE